jgi:1-phosphatidylinositol-3-phosphate 5-kinase
MYKIEDDLVILKRLISDAVLNWNIKFAEANSKKKDERQSRKQYDRGLTVNNNSGNFCGSADNDDYITEDTVSESQIEDLSPISADYNAVDAITSIQTEIQTVELAIAENSISDLTDVPVITNPEEIVIIQG